MRSTKTGPQSVWGAYFSTSGGLIPFFFIFFDILLFIIPFNIVFLLLRAPASLSSINVLEMDCILKSHLNQFGLWSCASIHLLLDHLCLKANESQQVRQFPVMPLHTSSGTTEQLWLFKLPPKPSQGIDFWLGAQVSWSHRAREELWSGVSSLIPELQSVLPEQQSPQPHTFVLRAELLMLSESYRTLKSVCNIKISLFYEYIKDTECARSGSVSPPVCILWETRVLAMLWAELKYFCLWSKQKKGKWMP